MLKINLSLLQQYIGKQVQDSPSRAGNWLQLTLKDIQSGEARLLMTVRSEMCNPYGMIHGGMMSLLIDEAIGWSVVSLASEQNYTSLNLMVDFLYGAAEGEVIEAHAYVVRKGKKIINAEVKVYNSKNMLLAKATSNLIVTSMSKKS